jgi:hypothetical protein
VVSGLKRQGYQVRVETVGVALAGHRAAKEALQCVASRTGGTYYDANGAAALSAALERISSDALGQLGRGRLVAGGRRLSRAPLITPGTYRTRIRAGQRAWYRFKAVPGQRPRVLATVEGLAALRVPSAARNCPAWRAELYNPYGEGGSYPPYGNSGIFDGVGIGSTGASSTSRLDPYSKGIDFNGTWAMQLSLARDTAKTCSEFLPPRLPFRARFSLQVGPQPATAASSPRASAPVSATPSPSASSVSEGGVAASAKYTTPARPQQTPVWLMPVVAVGVVAAAGVAAVGVLILRRRRRRGW